MLQIGPPVAAVLPAGDANVLAELQPIARCRRFRREQDIHLQGERCDFWYSVGSGATRKYLLDVNGRRHVVDIHLPGDFFGFSCRDRHRFGEQAIVEGTLIRCYPRTRAEALVDGDANLSRAIRARSFGTTQRLEEQLLILEEITARRKVHAFLTHFCTRLPRAPDGSCMLPVSRYDIADLLGLSAETVCRAFTELQELGAIRLRGPRHVRLIQWTSDFDR
jgi:CRP/FNR family transcriptional regulator, nitrogen fixation regulation protein